MTVTKLLSVPETAALLGVHPNTLRNWRKAGVGPTYVQISARKFMYPAEELRTFVSSRKTTHAA